MERLYPRALLSCIGEGRLPTAQELATLADKIWQEALSHRRGGWEQAVDIARAALVGQPAARP